MLVVSVFYFGSSPELIGIVVPEQFLLSNAARNLVKAAQPKKTRVECVTHKRSIALLISSENSMVEIVGEAAKCGSAMSGTVDMAVLDSKLINMLPTAVYVCEAPSGVIIRYNRQAAELWGREPALNDSEERFCGAKSLYYSDGRLLPHTSTPMADVLRGGSAVHDREVVVERQDGSRITVLVNIEPIHDDQGNVVAAVNSFQDISERKREEERVQRHVRDQRRLLEKLPTAAYTCDRKGLITYYNQAAVELWGRAPKLSNPVDRFCGSFKLFSADGKPITHDRCWMALALESRDSYNGREIIIERPDGTRVMALAHANPLEDDAGQLIGALNVLVDITERKRLEVEPQRLLGELRTERERLLEIFERSPAFVAVLRGPEHVFERVNKHYLELVGKRDLLGKTVREALLEVDGQGYFTALDEVYRTGEPFVGAGKQMTIRREPDGPLETRQVEFVFEPLRAADGLVSGVLVHGLDLTERLWVEENLARVTAESERWRRLYETVLSNTPDLVYVFDLNYHFTYANEALLNMLGLSAREEAIGRRLLELGYEPWHAAMHEREIDQVIATRKPVRGEVPFTGPLGARIYDYILVPVIDGQGNVEAIAGTTRDITEHKQLEDELQRRATELGNADRKKDEFIALLAHELRNPLAPIRNGLEVMALSKDKPNEMAKVRDMMDRQLGHMVRLVDDLLDVSRMSQNKLNLQMHRVLLSDVVDSAVEVARPAIDDAGQVLTIKLPPEPVYLNADLTRLAQIFGNLLSNSSKYTESGGHIWFTAEQHNREVVISVRDNGLGIPEAALPTIFDMFSQVPDSMDRSGGGLGIGLALVGALVEMHGGTISAESPGLNRGSTFTVRLTTAEGRGEMQAQSPAIEHNTEVQTRRILVVDDNQDSSDSMATVLEMLGHELRVAYDGLEAVAVAEAFRPELVLMDMGMPKLNGCDAVRRIRQQAWGKTMTIVALTGWGQDSDRALSRDAGCDEHLVKPVRLADLERLALGLTRADLTRDTQVTGE